MATLLTGLLGYIEIAITTVRPLRYRVKDINILIHTVIHTYHPDITEPAVHHYQDMTQNTASFELNQIDLYNIDTQSIPLVHNVQPSEKLSTTYFSSTAIFKK